MQMCIVLLALMGCVALASGAGTEIALFVSPGGPPDADGTRERPYRTIQEAVDKHGGDWGQVFLGPGVYEEDVDLGRTRLWFFPAMQYGVELRGTITVRRSGIKLRGIDIRSDGDGIVLAEGASDIEIQHCRILDVGEGCAGIVVDAPGCTSGLIGGNVIDLRDSERTSQVGIRVRVNQGTTGLRFDHNRIAGCDVGIAFEAGDGATDESNVISTCEVFDNAVGLRVAGPGVRANGCKIYGNSTAGVEVLSGPATIEACSFRDNAVGLTTRGDGVVVRNNVMLGAPPAVTILAGRATLSNNSLHSADPGATLVHVAEGASVDLSANILSGAGELLEAVGEVIARGNLFSHETAAAAADPDAIFGDPGFVDAQGGNLHLSDGSPALGAAKGSVAAVDAEGVGRPRGQDACVGAYEAAGNRAGTEYFVAAGAEDGDGSQARPFGLVADALAKTLPGDIVTLAPGEYSEAVTIERSGAPGALITVRSAEPHGAVFRDCVWTFNECSHVRVEGLSFIDCTRGFVLGPYVHDCELVGNSIVREGEGGGAISISGPGATGNLMEGNVIALNHGGVGLQINCQRFNWGQTIRGNDISGCYYGVQSGGGSYPTAPPGYHVVEDNEFHHNWKDGYHSKTTDNILRGNYVHHNSSTGITTRYGARNVIFGNRVCQNGGHGMRLHSPSHFVMNNLVYATCPRGPGRRRGSSRTTSSPITSRRTRCGWSTTRSMAIAGRRSPGTRAVASCCCATSSLATMTRWTGYLWAPAPRSGSRLGMCIGSAGRRCCGSTRGASTIPWPIRSSWIRMRPTSASLRTARRGRCATSPMRCQQCLRCTGGVCLTTQAATWSRWRSRTLPGMAQTKRAASSDELAARFAF